MRTTQETLNAVIASGHYSTKSPAPEMCLSLFNAWEHGVITYSEYKQAVIEIQDYIRGFAFLSTALTVNDLPADRPSRLAIYKDWANRPTLTRSSLLNNKI